MSQLSLERQFPLIILPNRSFQLLLDEALERRCLKTIYRHLTDDGTFIIDVGNFMGTKEKERLWVNEDEYFDWENTHPELGYHVSRFHVRKEIDIDKQVIVPHKIYRVTWPDKREETVIKRSPWKYFWTHQIRSLIVESGFEIIREMGSYAGAEITEENPEFIFICKKQS
jgi:hypothetical protein